MNLLVFARTNILKTVLSNVKVKLTFNEGCNRTCFTCSGSANNCTSCKIDEKREYVRKNGKLLSTCNCITGYYDDINLKC